VLRRFFDRPLKIEPNKTPVEKDFAVHAQTENALAALPETLISGARGLFCDLY
jgi:hypothetical protein